MRSLYRLLLKLLQDSLARPRFYTTAVVFFAAFALLLAVIGVYGAASHSLAQRTHEIGIRTAVGASPVRLRAMLLREHMMPVMAGVLAGIVGAIAMGRLLQSFIDTAEPVSNGSSSLAAAALALAAGVAVWSATRRIVKMNPLAALRTE
jgi:ABC-type antimicrobial peptide transport system permease subunit